MLCNFVMQQIADTAQRTTTMRVHESPQTIPTNKTFSRWLKFNWWTLTSFYHGRLELIILYIIFSIFCRCAALCQCCRERKFHIIGFQPIETRALAPPHATDSFSIGNTTKIIGMELNFPFPSQQPAHTIRAPRLVRYRLIRLCNKHFYFSITRVNLVVDAAICKLCLKKTTHSNLSTTKTSMRLPYRRRWCHAFLSYRFDFVASFAYMRDG